MPDTVDVSSYKQPALPTTLDTFGKLQSLQQGAQNIQRGQIAISKDQLDLANARFANIIRDVNSLPPEATQEDFFKMGQNAVNQGVWTPENYTQFVQSIPSDPKQLPQFKQQFLGKAMSAQEMINWHYGQNANVNTGQTVTPGLTSNRPGFNAGNPFKATSLPIQQQAPPTTPTYDQNNQPRLLGAQPPQLAPGTVSQPTPLPTGPINNSAIQGQSSNFGGNVNGATVLPVQQPSPAQTVQNRFPTPSGPATGGVPGVVEAEREAGSASGTQLAQDRTRAANFQRDVFPLAQAIPALEKLGTKGTGPGTETFNHLKSFILSNVPGINEKDPTFATVGTFDKAKKYLTDFVNQTGNSGTNDKLAAAFAGNPSVGISNAAAVDVAKSALALRRMQQAQIQEFDRLNLPASQYSKWVSQKNSELDPRAFGVDLMSDDAKTKLRTQLNKNKNERIKFEKSLELAHGLGFLTPQQQ